MFLIPLNQLESVELVVHALRMAGGQADCTTCPARKVCMKQCLSVADGIAQMMETGALPRLDGQEQPSPPDASAEPESPEPESPEPGGHLRRIK